jgi:hypothetical protein
MNTNVPSKQPRPSYEEGKVRDPKVAAMQERDFQRSDFSDLVKKAVAVIRKSDAKHEE